MRSGGAMTNFFKDIWRALCRLSRACCPTPTLSVPVEDLESPWDPTDSLRSIGQTRTHFCYASPVGVFCFDSRKKAVTAMGGPRKDANVFQLDLVRDSNLEWMVKK
jgi:hypothetical protein